MCVCIVGRMVSFGEMCYCGVCRLWRRYCEELFIGERKKFNNIKKICIIHKIVLTLPKFSCARYIGVRKYIKLLTF